MFRVYTGRPISNFSCNILDFPSAFALGPFGRLDGACLCQRFCPEYYVVRDAKIIAMRNERLTTRAGIARAFLIMTVSVGHVLYRSRQRGIEGGARRRPQVGGILSGSDHRDHRSLENRPRMRDVDIAQALDSTVGRRGVSVRDIAETVRMTSGAPRGD
jgi:hypothetical protein